MASETTLRPGEIKDILLREIEAADLNALDVQDVGTVLEVRDGRVEVRFSGTCSHCPASDYTLSERFERAVRARYPGALEVVSRGDPAGRPFLGIPVLRRR